MSRVRSGALSATGAVLGSACAVAGVVALGLSSPEAMHGARVLFVGGAVGLAAGLLIRFGWSPARVVGATLGGAAGGFFALTCVEWTGGFTQTWALHGGGYGLMFGVPVAAFIGGLGGFLREPPPA